MNPIITLTTDFGTKDYFVGAVKGRIYTELPNAKIVDISHKITPFSINEAAYVVKNAYTHFPKGSIHIIAVDAESSIENKHIVVLLDGHFFICPNNGVVSLICSQLTPEKVIEMHIPQEKSTYFLENFVTSATHIARGKKMDLLGQQLQEIKIMHELKPLVNQEKNQIIGNVVYIDNFGNTVSNINQKLFDEIGDGRNFEIKTRYYTFNKIYNAYNEIVNFEIEKHKRNDDGKSLLLFNSDHYLEIAVYRSNLTTVGGASSLLSLTYRDTITVRFL